MGSKPLKSPFIGSVPMFKPEKHEGVVLTSRPVNKLLIEREAVAYTGHRKQFIEWLAYEGKDPEAMQGYAYDTYRVYANIISQFHRYVWETEGRFTLDLTHAHADDCLKEQVKSGEYSESYLHNTKLSLLAYFRFNHAPSLLRERRTNPGRGSSVPAYRCGGSDSTVRPQSRFQES